MVKHAVYLNQGAEAGTFASHSSMLPNVYSTPAPVMVGGFLYLIVPELLPAASIALTTLYDSTSPSGTWPKTTCLPSSHEVTVVVTKNCDPLLRHVSAILCGHPRCTHVLGPALAMDRRKGFWCLSLKFSSANFSP